jgi:hypothetical protein
MTGPAPPLLRFRFLRSSFHQERKVINKLSRLPFFGALLVEGESLSEIVLPDKVP